MPKETRVIYKLSDIVGILVPCPDCGKEIHIPLDYNPDTDGRTSGFMCPHCLKYGLGTVCASFASIVRRFERAATEVPQLNQIRIEFTDDPTDG